MLVISINGSSRADGNTALLINTIFEELETQGIATKQIQLHDKTIGACTGCFACKGKKRCVVDNDDFGSCFESLCSADGMIFGSPVYSADVSSKMKAFLERAGAIAAVNPRLFARKVGASVAAVRRGGGLHAVDTMNHFFLNKEMFVVGGTYWNMVYGKDVGDVLNDAEGIANMKSLAANMAWLLKKVCSD